LLHCDRRGRITINEKDNILQNTEEALKRKEQEDEERRKQSHDLVAESIKRELAESARGFSSTSIQSPIVMLI
jgi:microfibrillar-associated protein 1